MKLKVENLGAIDKGEVTFNKNLIIFTGPNNTGKSYLSYLIYAIKHIHSLFDRLSQISELEKFFNESKIINEYIKSNKKISVEDAINDHLNYFNELFSKSIETNTTKIFASTKITPVIEIDIENLKLDYKENDISGIKIENNKVYPIIGDINKIDVPSAPFSVQGKTLHQNIASTLSILVTFGITSNPLFGKSYIFPSERSAINLFARDIISKKAGARDEIAFRVLSGEDISQIAKSIATDEKANPKYPLALNDYINFVNSFEGTSSTSELSFLADELENEIMGGTIGLSEYKQIIFRPHSTEQSLNLHESSSLVKSLSYLSVYLRHYAAVGDWVIIDEPEINLHPNLQVTIAKLFARMVNAGLKVILSTHSDYLIKELNTLLLLNDLSKIKGNASYIKNNGYSKEELIDKDQVEAYYLNNNKINLIDVISNGIVVPSINKTISEIDNLSEDIFFKLSQSKLAKTKRNN